MELLRLLKQIKHFDSQMQPFMTQGPPVLEGEPRIAHDTALMKLQIASSKASDAYIAEIKARAEAELEAESCA
jgi:hypothetical protein